VTKQEANAHLIGYWEKAANENDEKVNKWEELAAHTSDKRYAEFLRFEARVMKEQAARFREAARVWKELS
jgi:rubrerythrin